MTTTGWTDWLAFADQVSAAADLADDVRKVVATDLAVGNAEWAIFDAVLGTRSPLPVLLLERIRSDALPMRWYGPDDHKLLVDALDRQTRQHAFRTWPTVSSLSVGLVGVFALLALWAGIASAHAAAAALGGLALLVFLTTLQDCASSTAALLRGIERIEFPEAAVTDGDGLARLNGRTVVRLPIKANERERAGVEQ
jgi:hypothetical protein